MRRRAARFPIRAPKSAARPSSAATLSPTATRRGWPAARRRRLRSARAQRADAWRSAAVLPRSSVRTPASAATRGCWWAASRGTRRTSPPGIAAAAARTSAAGAPASSQHRLDGGADGVTRDRVHAASMRAFGGGSAAAAHPRDVAAEQDRLVAAGERVDAHRAIRARAPEVAGAADDGGAGAEQRDGRRADDAAQVCDAGVRRYQQACAGDEVPHLRNVELAGVARVARRRVDGVHEAFLAGTAGPHRCDAARGEPPVSYTHL